MAKKKGKNVVGVGAAFGAIRKNKAQKQKVLDQMRGGKKKGK